MNKASKLFNKFKKGTIKHSPEILVSLGIVSGISSTVLAVKATPKALMLIEEEKIERRKNDEDDNLNPLDVVKVAWKPYIPAAVSGVAGIACILGAHSVNTRRNAAIATAYKLTETAFKDYKDAVIEEIGEKKEDVVKKKVAEKKLQKEPIDNKEVIITGNGNVLCFDSISSRYFESNIESIRKAVNNLNADLISRDYISLNEFYYELGLAPTSIGDQLGWNSAYGLVEVEFDTQLASDGRPCVVINYDIAPRYDFSKLM